jgi:hypothetical protein
MMRAKAGDVGGPTRAEHVGFSKFSLMRGVRQAVPPVPPGDLSAGLEISILLNVNSNLYKLVRDKRANRVTVVFRIGKQVLH